MPIGRSDQEKLLEFQADKSTLAVLNEGNQVHNSAFILGFLIHHSQALVSLNKGNKGSQVLNTAFVLGFFNYTHN